VKRTHVMLSERTAEQVRRMKAETGADTMTEVLADAVAAYSALSQLVKDKSRVLALVNPSDGSFTQLSIPSLSRTAVWEHPTTRQPQFLATARNQEPELPLDLFEAPASAAYDPHPPMAIPHGHDRMAAARAAQERAHATTGLAPPDKPLILPHQRPGKTMMSVDEVATAMTMSEARVRAALRDGKYEGAELVDGEWWIPQSEVKARR
jgi:hypothetical protein